MSHVRSRLSSQVVLMFESGGNGDMRQLSEGADGEDDAAREIKLGIDGEKVYSTVLGRDKWTGKRCGRRSTQTMGGVSMSLMLTLTLTFVGVELSFEWMAWKKSFNLSTRKTIISY